MAIIDKQLVFVDAPVRANGSSRAVPLTGMTLPGRMRPIPLRLTITEGYEPTAVASLTLTLQQAAHAQAPESGEGAWEDVPGASLRVSGADLHEGARLPWRFLPEGVTQPWVRLTYAFSLAGNAQPVTGALFAAIMREEDFPYTPRQRVR